jgi:Tol biopolymer transport system component
VINLSDNDTSEVQMTFPSWSPDGNYIYYCRASQNISFDAPEMDQIIKTHYNLARKPFDPVARTFGDTEIVFDAAAEGKSVSFPRISPDGRFVVITLADYGTFPVWHLEADLYMIDLQTGAIDSMSINSNRTESFHSWSENGRWLAFSSRRLDGRSGRPYFAYIYPDGRQGKEFVLPQRDPTLYDRMLESFNIPELVNGKIRIGPRDLAAASRKEALRAKPGMPEDEGPFNSKSQINGQNKDNQRSIHE